jgi:DNA-binding NtrC family response regulator
VLFCDLSATADCDLQLSCSFFIFAKRKNKAMAKILIIDDERSIRNTLKDILTFESHNVDLAEDGKTGIQLAAENTYDVIFCDIKMPQMDGIEVLESLHESAPEVPVVMISGHGNIETAVEAIKKGAFDFIPKPLDLNR